MFTRALVFTYGHGTRYPQSDPRHGVISGGDEGDTFVAYYETYGSMSLLHAYSCTGNTFRGFEDAGLMWKQIAVATGRDDIAAHADELLQTAPKVLAAMQASLNKTIFATGNPRAPRCVPSGADPATPPELPEGTLGDFRGYPELMYSATLSSEQANDVYTYLSYGNNSLLGTRPMTLGCTGYNNKQTTYTAYGMAYGLLVHDMVERFLLHYFGMSCHTYTRGTWTTPEAVHPDRDVGSTDYVAAGVHTAPTYLKWALLFEEPNSRTVWIGKALPREWLTPGETPVVVDNATTRYGRVSYTLSAAALQGRSSYTVTANVTLPTTYVGAVLGPSGGVRLRLRTPLDFVGAMKRVTVGGVEWPTFDPEAETVDFGAAQLTLAVLHDMKRIVVYYSNASV